MNFQTNVSGCCGATETDTRNSDTGFCPACGEHTKFIPDTEYFDDEETDKKVNSLIGTLKDYVTPQKAANAIWCVSLSLLSAAFLWSLALCDNSDLLWRAR